MKVNRFTKFLDKRKRRTFKNIFPWCMVIVLIASAIGARCIEAHDLELITERYTDYVENIHSRNIEIINELSESGDIEITDINFDAFLTSHSYRGFAEVSSSADIFGISIMSLDTEIISWIAHELAKKGADLDFLCGNFILGSVIYSKDIAADNSKEVIFIKSEPTDKNTNKYHTILNNLYTCDLESLGNKKLTAYCIKKRLFDDRSMQTGEYYDYKIKSAYVNRSNHTFIPHEVELSTGKMHYYDEPTDDGIIAEPIDIVVTDTIFIDCDDSNYELIERKDTYYDPEKYDEPPTGWTTMFCNSDKEFCNNIKNYYYTREKYIQAREEADSMGTAVDETLVREYGNYEEWYSLNLHYNPNIAKAANVIDYNGQELVYITYYRTLPDNIYILAKVIFIFDFIVLFILLTIIALIYSAVKGFLNKTSCAMEDYQRTLTNNLAHDLKTPLAAIGGYAENLIDQRKDIADEKEIRYLGSIMENVAYTDSMIKKTLKLAEIEKMQKRVISKVSLRSLTENAFEKYRLQLEERKITLSIEGNYGINAEEATLTDAIENLVSNAVKYTPKGGSISVTMKNSEYRITNDVTRKVDIKGLKKPFVKGDTSRHDKNSSGLGLSIADTALRRNGYKLKLSCDDSCFSAWIKL